MRGLRLSEPGKTIYGDLLLLSMGYYRFHKTRVKRYTRTGGATSSNEAN